jgi:hypothetical protein
MLAGMFVILQILTSLIEDRTVCLYLTIHTTCRYEILGRVPRLAAVALSVRPLFTDGDILRIAFT